MADNEQLDPASFAPGGENAAFDPAIAREFTEANIIHAAIGQEPEHNR